MLIRSPKSESNSRNFDVVFVAVEYIDLPARLNGLSIMSGNAADAASFAEKTGRAILEERVFAVTTNGRRYTVIAAGLRAEENDLDLFDGGLERFTP
jgi:hypothetical protein